MCSMKVPLLWQTELGDPHGFDAGHQEKSGELERGFSSGLVATGQGAMVLS